jgi:hypothetical protein
MEKGSRSSPQYITEIWPSGTPPFSLSFSDALHAVALAAVPISGTTYFYILFIQLGTFFTKKVGVFPSKHPP